MTAKGNPEDSEDRQAELNQMKKSIQKYSRPDDFKAWQAIGVTIMFEIISAVLINFDCGVLGWSLHTINYLRLFVQFHDMAHFSYFSTITMNKIVGKVIGVMVHFPFNAWRDGHNHHHKHFGNLDRLDASQTILFTKKQYQQMKGAKKILVRILRQPIIFFLFAEPLLWFVGTFAVLFKRYGFFSTTYWEKVLAVLVATFVVPLFGIPALKWWLAKIFAQIIGTYVFHMQHSVNVAYRERKDKWDHTRAALEGSTFVQVPLWLKPFTNGIEYHHIHHLNTNVASYNMALCHEDFEYSNKEHNRWDVFHINRVDWVGTVKSLGNVMMDEEKGVLVPFDYGF